MASLFGDDSSLHGSTIFGTDSLSQSRVVAEEESDPWAAATPVSSAPTSSVSSLLSGASIPDIYSIVFDDSITLALKKDPSSPKDSVSVSALDALFTQLSLSQGTKTKIYSLIGVTPHDPRLAPEAVSSTSVSRIDRGTWNVAVALAAFSQKGSTDQNLSLTLVDFSRNSLPHISIPKYQSKLYKESSPVSSPTKQQRRTVSSSSTLSQTSPSGKRAVSGVNTGLLGTVWESSVDPSNYNPLSKNTISVSLVPKREGTLFFRHVNYVVEGILPASIIKNDTSSSSTTIASSTQNLSSSTTTTTSSGNTRFKVIRRYSDFDWLLESLQRKYPFRLLPILPPKRLSGMC